MKFAVMICAGALLLAGDATAQEGSKTISKTTISFATATPGGGFPLYGNAFAEAMNAADTTLSIEPRNTKGSNENIPLLEAGSVDIATVAGEPSYEAFMGIGRPKATKLKILTAMYSSPGMFVVRADSPYKTIQDLVGQSVAFGAKGSGLPILSRYILDGIGLRQDEDFTSIYLDRAGDGPAMVEDGRAAALWGAGIGWPGFSKMAESASGARFIAPTADEIARIRAKHTFLKPLTIPAGSYPKQTAAISSVGSWSYILVRETLPEDVAYRLAKTLHGVEADFCKKLAQACETTAANTVAAAPDINLIHPGVLKYFREIGVAR
ncbi:MULTISPECIES: TAXI family TRAP transporter solute-binding subunit [unclassified Bradyrhizobium]|uniref:TAXI family TRAP transporter solute-binding subunit n=1 Tax=unclassified Bradyrhizobium TaxID=2631580 RepID=UPI001BA56185|nr:MULTISPECIES: TAXI family TRAP transporter solute-binding subunit [unclassified Bradyrhizobium]MBR1208949.1 TAXI family TRAP transporter solute-binding subunit [Bradyrhizobium sp. AUGA SZCCT0124]MBR1317203.1 TAXI family TRAP transporter solute-binding subunit [Bradyrhizobium sp. AUGA SZCCT0051]MBR1345622.1 TAXI family TRAP transporter solute-binding subunit [Bradyrhizobium sp. AUGA SZCCT0105]MBR1360361.1 TAXI family TRAP transporter solute-binding subunit [Bradyrhizobium sp. AUGA SZCCT0045]